MQLHKTYLLIITSVMLAFAAQAKPRFVPGQFTEAIKNGETNLEFRLRYENSKQQGLLEGKATTLRSRVGYETAEFSGAAIKVELVDVANFFGQNFNPGVSDLAKPNYTLIQDPRGAGVTEAKFMYYGFTNNIITLGRQYINLDNQRFVGWNNFRQYPQSFDAFGIQSCMIDSLDIYYTYITNVNTNFGNGRGVEGRRSLSTNLVHVDWSGYRYGQLVGYIYFNDDHTVNTNSNITFGVRLSNPSEYAEFDQIGYSVEVARQQARFNNPNTYVVFYAHFTLSKTIDWFTGVVGLEKLGGKSNGANRCFITPLASVDDFNGIAEVFNTTPNRGLQDYYARISATSHDITIAAIYHYFRLDRGPGSKRAGQELDLVGEIALSEQVTLSTAYARYMPKNNVAPKTRRFWIMLNANLL